MRVGVVYDEPTVLAVLARMLATENFELVVASSGPEMMEKLRPGAGDLDLLITDFAMPEMHGRELAHRVRQRFPTAKVLYQTGCADLLFENGSELEDGAAFVEKPVSVRALREAVRLALFGVLNPV
jgi:CheY-like chemotaxis protein